MIPADGTNKPLIHARGHDALPDQATSLGAATMNGVHAPSALIPLPVAPTSSQTPTLGALLVALKRRWFPATLLAIVAAVVVVGGLALMFPPKYVTQARLELNSRAVRPFFSLGGDPDVDPAIFRSSQSAIIKSPLVLTRALNSDKLKGTPVSGSSPESLEGALKVDFAQGPEIMTIKLYGNEPDDLAKTLEAIIESYVEESRNRDNRRRLLLVAELDRTLEESVKTLNNKRLELRKQEMVNKLPDPSMMSALLQMEGSKLYGSQNSLRECEDNLTQKQFLLGEKSAQLKTVETAPIPAHKLAILYSTNLQLQQYHQNFALLGAEITKWMQQLDSPIRDAEIKNLREQQAAIQQNIKDTQDALRPDLEVRYRGELRDSLEQEVKSLEANIQQLETRKTTLLKQVGDATAEVEKINMASRKPGVVVDKLRDEVKQIEKTQEKLAADVALLRAEPAISSKVVVLKSPETPTSRDVTQLGKIGTIGGLGTFFFVLLGVAYIEFRSRKVNAPEEVTQELGMTLVGTMPRLPVRVQRTVHNGASPETAQWQSIITESIDAIRTQLLHAARSDGVQVVMVTSATGGEGKTSLSSQLAASLARAWRKTLLVDGDLRNPAAHKLFHMHLEPGLSEILRSESTLAEAVKPTSLSRLWLLPAGHWDAHAVQALAQEEVRTTFDQMKQQYDFIIVDSCPVLPVADSLLLGQYVDAVIFSVLRDVSRLPSVRAAQQKLQGLGVRMLGAVVIGADNDPGSLIYRYVGRTRP